MKTILLVEDDFLNRRLSKKTLSESGFHILEAANTRDAIALLNKEMIDVAILDINLGEDEKDGISLGQELQDRYHIPFLYLTAYDNAEIAKRAIVTTPQAYITKPFKNIDLITAVTLAIQQSSVVQRKPTLLVKEDDYNVELPIDDIDFVASEGNYVLVHSGNKIYKSRSTIKQILELLPDRVFIQVHRAFIVNKTKIAKFNAKSLVIGKVTIPLSKGYIDVVNERPNSKI